MLVLSRKIGESIVIGNDIRVTITDIVNGKVKIGVTAPREVPVHRKEVFEAIRDFESLEQAK